ncbi:MAG: hypothetical protein H7842_11995 [Gammaproteobacteria bacterium SHHR-1]
MQVEAIYDQGKLEFLTPLQLKHNRLRLVVEVPDEEIVPTANPCNLPSEIVEAARAMREKLDAIRNAPLPPDDELPDLTEKQLNRMAAFDLREDR